MSEESTEAGTEAARGESADDADAAPLPACPRCGDPVTSVTTRGPTDHVAAPCGCRVAPPDLRPDGE